MAGSDFCRNALFIMVLVSYASSHSPAQHTFQKTFGGTALENGFFVQQTSDLGYIMGGRTFSFGSGAQSVYLVKTDSMGFTEWSKFYGGTGSEFAYAVKQTPDGGYIMTGFTTSFGAGGSDIYLIRTDNKGDTLWTGTYGGTGTEEPRWSVEIMPDSGYVLTGFTGSFGAGGNDVYLIRVSKSGTLLWSKTYGGTGADLGNDVKQTMDGGFIITGQTNSFGAGNYDVYVVKTNASGDIQWTKTYGGSNFDTGSGIAQMPDSGYVITGYTKSFGAGNDDYLLIRTDKAGNVIWSKTYGGTNNDRANMLQITGDKGFIICGWSSSFGGGNGDVYLVRTDSLGNIIWNKAYGGPLYDPGIGVQQTADGGFVAFGWTASFGAGSDDFYLIKTDGNGYSGGCNEFTVTPVTGSPVLMVASGGTAASGGVTNTPASLTGNTTTLDSIRCAGTCLLLSSFAASMTIACENDTLHFISQSKGATSYQWLDNGIMFGTTAAISRIFTQSGTRNIELIAVNGNCRDTSRISITVIPSPQVTFTGLDTFYCLLSNPAILTGFPPGGIFSGPGITGNQFSTFLSGTGNHQISYVFTDTNSCTGISIQNVTVTVCPGINDEPSASAFQVYPNPAVSHLIIEINTESDGLVRIEIIDLSGRRIFNTQEMTRSKGFKTSLSTDMIPAGMYCLSVSTPDKVFRHKLVIH
jgi:hypothetical protein